MTYKHFKSKTGMFFSGAYLLLILVVIIEIITSKPDAMSGVALIFLAMPWSVILFEVLPDADLPIFGLALYGFCVFLNAAILYVFGMALGGFARWLKRLIDRQNEWASKKPQL